IRSALLRYRLWDNTLADRIVAVPGDLAAPWLGLSEPEFDRLEPTILRLYDEAGADTVDHPGGIDESPSQSRSPRLRPPRKNPPPCGRTAAGRAVGSTVTLPVCDATGVCMVFPSEKWKALFVVFHSRRRGDAAAAPQGAGAHPLRVAVCPPRVASASRGQSLT
ncbi:SDR family oxidoreductase, partial [Nocardia cyriacigeorgica]|uniref:SDR family oxidoreductase n=1 Tax=Nocardia cyriacigeorgica TaxID=135487 RepID=UPI002457FC9D